MFLTVKYIETFQSKIHLTYPLRALLRIRPRGFQTTQEEIEYAAFFLRLGLSPTIIRHENGAFQKQWRDNYSVFSRPEFS